MLLKVGKKLTKSNLQFYLQWESHSCGLGEHQTPTNALCLNDQIPGPDLQHKIYGTSTINPQQELLTRFTSYRACDLSLHRNLRVKVRGEAT